MYAAIGLALVVAYLVGGGNTLVTDAAGVVWRTGSIAEAEATVSIFTMIFVAALSTARLFQRSTAAPNASIEAKTDETPMESDAQIHLTKSSISTRETPLGPVPLVEIPGLHGGPLYPRRSAIRSICSISGLHVKNTISSAPICSRVDMISESW